MADGPISPIDGLAEREVLVEHYADRLKEILPAGIVVPEVHLEPMFAPQYAQRYPAVLSSTTRSKAAVMYDPRAVSDVRGLFDPSGDHEELGVAIDRLYIAGSIGFGVLQQLIDRKDRNKLRSFTERLSSTLALRKDIRHDTAFTIDGQEMLASVIEILPAAQRVTIGMLRFVNGLLARMTEEDQTRTILREAGIADLNATLASEREYNVIAGANVLRPANETDTTIEDHSSDPLGEHIRDIKTAERIESMKLSLMAQRSSELSFGFAYPASSEEIATLCRIALNKATERTIL